jgi:hypothetical protein
MKAKVTISFVMDVDEDQFDGESFTMWNYVEEELEMEGLYTYIEDEDFELVAVEEVKE